jgi:DNA-binding HxlR family transcriptional regulator
MSKMADSPHVTPIQTKILIALVRSKDGSMYTDEILRQTGIATSTWSAEQGKLVALGLVNKHLVRIIEQDHVSKRMSYWLTERGKMVSLNLLNISRILAAEQAASKNTSEEPGILRENKKDIFRPEAGVKEAEEFRSKIAECVEVALDSFGANLVNLVKSSLELEHHISWAELPDRANVFENVLKDYFGLEASKKLKILIAANIRNRFGLENFQVEDLALIISEARKNDLKDVRNPEVAKDVRAEVYGTER